MYEGAEDYYFWLGVECGKLKNATITFPKTRIMEEIQNAYSFGKDLGLVLTDQEYQELVSQGIDYMNVLKTNYTEGVLNEKQTYS